MLPSVFKGNIGRDASASDLLFRLVEPVEAAIARQRRRRLVGTYVGVTGSCGKSTTVAAIAAALRAHGSVRASRLTSTTRAALRTLRKLDGQVDYVVQELGGNYPGAIAGTTRHVPPDVAVVTAVGGDHWRAFRSLEAIAAEKGSLVAALPPGGLACLNADDPHVRAMAGRTTARVVLYGEAADAQVRAENIVTGWPALLRFDLVVDGARLPVVTRFIGRLMVTNLLAAFAVVHGLGLALAPAVAALASLEPVPQHMSLAAGPHGHTYVLDTYKAPHWSTLRLVEEMAAWQTGPRIFVLGQMSDMKGDAGAKYRDVVAAASRCCDLVVGVGWAASAAGKLAARSGGTVIAAAGYAELMALLAARPPSLVVLKSSAAINLGDIVTHPGGGRFAT